ncbi:MAG: helix-turn-helix domain-containing protein [Vicinamibacterales bacterium]
MRHAEKKPAERGDLVKQHGLPALLTSGEVAELLRTSRKAVYAMAERAQVPGVVRINRRLLFREDALLDWLRQKSKPSLEGR